MRREPGQRAPFKTKGARIPAEEADQLDADAERLGLTQSEYIRMAFSLTLRRKVTPETAQKYKMETQRRNRATADA